MKVDAFYDRGMKVHLFSVKKRYEGRQTPATIERYEGIPLFGDQEV